MPNWTAGLSSFCYLHHWWLHLNYHLTLQNCVMKKHENCRCHRSNRCSSCHCYHQKLLSRHFRSYHYCLLRCHCHCYKIHHWRSHFVHAHHQHLHQLHRLVIQPCGQCHYEAHPRRRRRSHCCCHFSSLYNSLDAGLLVGSIALPLLPYHERVVIAIASCIATCHNQPLVVIVNSGEAVGQRTRCP